MPSRTKPVKPRVSYKRQGSTFTIRVTGSSALTAEDLWTGLLPLDDEPGALSQPPYVLAGFTPGHFLGWKEKDLDPFDGLLDDIEAKAGGASFWDLTVVGGQPATPARLAELMKSESAQVRELASYGWRHSSEPLADLSRGGLHRDDEPRSGFRSAPTVP